VEFFGETEIPIVQGLYLAEELFLTASARYTDDEFFGTQTTYAVGANYSPVDWLTLRARRGTSFRAPNLREQFLAQEEGFVASTIDPCVTPAGEDNRPQQIIENCQAVGIDPFDFPPSASVLVISGGNPELEAEESTSFTGGVVFSQPFFEQFDLDIAIDYADIEIDNAVATLSANFIVNECFTSPNLSDALCANINRNPNTLRIESIDETFVNIAEEDFQSINVSVLAEYEPELFGQVFTLTGDYDVSHVLERTEGITEEDIEEFAGTIGIPTWQVRGTTTVSWRDLDVFHNFFFRDRSQQFDSDPLGPEGFRDVDFIGAYVTHSIGVTYQAERFEVFAAIENMLDDSPDLVDDGEFTNVSNVPLGVVPQEGITGRSFNLGVIVSF
jgi:iron complex outermembrane receptor protein